jgi:hypothetical protein
MLTLAEIRDAHDALADEYQAAIDPARRERLFRVQQPLWREMSERLQAQPVLWVLSDGRFAVSTDVAPEPLVLDRAPIGLAVAAAAFARPGRRVEPAAFSPAKHGRKVLAQSIRQDAHAAVVDACRPLADALLRIRGLAYRSRSRSQHLAPLVVYWTLPPEKGTHGEPLKPR